MTKKKVRIIVRRQEAVKNTGPRHPKVEFETVRKALGGVRDSSEGK